MQQLFEGRDPALPRAEPQPLKNLCLPPKLLDGQNPGLNVTYDIDGLCLFPTGLGVARQGLFWQPIPHPIMNIASDLYFTLPIDL
jgi:hypothetical protein